MSLRASAQMACVDPGEIDPGPDVYRRIFYAHERNMGSAALQLRALDRVGRDITLASMDFRAIIVPVYVVGWVWQFRWRCSITTGWSTRPGGDTGDGWQFLQTGSPGSAWLAPSSGEWEVTVEELGLTSPEDSAYYETGWEYRDYAVSITWNGTEVLQETAHWPVRPGRLRLNCANEWPSIGGGRAGGGLTGVAIPHTEASIGNKEHVWPWNSPAELDDWTLVESSYYVNDQVEDSAPAVISGGMFTAPLRTTYPTGTRAGTYCWYEFGRIWQGQGGRLDMYTCPVTGVPWIAWEHDGTIKTAYLDDAAAETWIEREIAQDFAGCVGVGITGDGRAIVVSAENNYGHVFVWRSENQGRSWSNMIQVS